MRHSWLIEYRSSGISPEIVGSVALCCAVAVKNGACTIK